MKLFFDIETIPTQNQTIIEAIKSQIKHPGNITKKDTIEKWYQENYDAEFDKAYRKTALDGLYGEIISIAWATNDDPVKVAFRSTNDGAINREVDLLKAFFSDITNLIDKHGQKTQITRWIGHYITEFDLRYLWQRCVVNGLNPGIKIPYEAKPWDDEIFDTKIAWTGTSSKYAGVGSLEAICLGLGLDGKTKDGNDITGATVWDAWQEGRFEDIAHYNKIDVEECRNLYRRMNFMKIEEIS